MADLLVEAAYHSGADAKASNMQRVVPKFYWRYESYWLAGYDGKPLVMIRKINA